MYKRQAKDEIEKRIAEASEMLGLGQLLARFPRQLSGGQRQRVAMGRAIVRRAQVFLFDEPLSNLDAALRAQVRVDIRKLHDRIGATSVYVTHDQVEAMTLADRIFVLNKGRVEQSGPPLEVYACLLYTSDAADERSSVDLGGRRIIQKKQKKNKKRRRNATKTQKHNTNNE